MVEDKPVYGRIDALSGKSDVFNMLFRKVRERERESNQRRLQMPKSKCSKAAFLQVLEYLCWDNFTLNIKHAFELHNLAYVYHLEGLKLSCICLRNITRGERTKFAWRNEKHLYQVLQNALSISRSFSIFSFDDGNIRLRFVKNIGIQFNNFFFIF